MANFMPEECSSQTSVEALRAENHDLRAALRTRAVIEQAKGVLIARHGCSPDEAFRMLAGASQRNNRKLREIAAGVVASAMSHRVSDEVGDEAVSATGSRRDRDAVA